MLPIDVGFQHDHSTGSIHQLTRMFLRPDLSVLKPLNQNKVNIKSDSTSNEAEIKKIVDFQLPTNADWNDDNDDDGQGYEFGNLGEDDIDDDDDDDGFIMPVLDNVRKVDKVRVGYATIAKKVDVKRLKQDLWNQLESQLFVDTIDEVDENENDKMQDDEAIVNVANTSERASTVISFQDVVRTLGQQQSQLDITLPFYFICILHLANEKNLRLEQGGDIGENLREHTCGSQIEQQQLFLSDFTVYQE